MDPYCSFLVSCMLPSIFFFLLPLFLSFGEINEPVSREHSTGGFFFYFSSRILSRDAISLKKARMRIACSVVILNLGNNFKDGFCFLKLE